MSVAVFWDIDGTLLTTARAGVYSLEAALEEVSGIRTSLHGMATAGMTDYSIAEAALGRVGHATDEDTVQRFLRIHGAQLGGFLHKREGEVLPGVREVLEELDGRADVVNLLLTGNIEAGATAKLAHYGLAGFFQHGGAFSIGPGERAEIAHRALPLARGAEVYVIGDTPADVECGKAIRARTIAVATGSYGVDELRTTNPWAVFEQLPEPDAFQKLLGLAVRAAARSEGSGRLARVRAVSAQARDTFDKFAGEVEAWEQNVLGQRPFDSTHYDDHYFASDWREDENKYELETRRRIEGKNPELIRDVFGAEGVLDVGCGPGFLMQFLHELGIAVHGVDFSPASTDLAPPEMQGRIDIGPVEKLDFPDRSFDLVICREVMEHLTVLQVRRCVSEICRVSSRFAYITTRFHPDPESLLDFTTDFETDPTHITLLAKDFLRVLFVLESFHRRPDLEARMDWGGKGRVLVYERYAEGNAEPL